MYLIGYLPNIYFVRNYINIVVIQLHWKNNSVIAQTHHHRRVKLNVCMDGADGHISKTYPVLAYPPYIVLPTIIRTRTLHTYNKQTPIIY